MTDRRRSGPAGAAPTTATSDAATQGAATHGAATQAADGLTVPHGIVGTIRPDPAGGEAPLFRVVRRRPGAPGLENPPPNVRPCAHGAFVLDERWATVTCGRCGEKVDAFAALMSFAEWSEQLQQKADHARRAEKRMHVALLRNTVRHRWLPDDLRAEVTRVIRDEYRHTPDDVAALCKKVQRVEAEVRAQRDQARAQKPRDRGGTAP